MKSREPCKSVLITFHGDTTHATMLTGYNHDTRTKSACAKRNPADAYDAYIGAKLALDRLFGKEPAADYTKPEPKPKKEEPKCPFKIGDLVLTREMPFSSDCRNRPAKVVAVTPCSGDDFEIKLLVDSSLSDHPYHQYTNLTGYPGSIVHWLPHFGKHPMDGSPAPKDNSKFRVGDIVEIVDPYISGGAYKKGDIGVIVRKAVSGDGFYCRFIHDESAICCLPREMKLLYRPKEG